MRHLGTLGQRDRRRHGEPKHEGALLQRRRELGSELRHDQDPDDKQAGSQADRSAAASDEEPDERLVGAVQGSDDAVAQAGRRRPSVGASAAMT